MDKKIDKSNLVSLVKWVLKALGLLLLIGCEPKTYEIAYVTGQGNDNLDVFITNTGNGEAQNLTNSDATEYNLTWTADGTSIYFTSYENGGRKIKSINVTTKEVSTVIQDSLVLSVSDVSLDNRKLIISTKEHHPKGELYIYDRESGEKKRLTNNELYEAGAKFSPDQKIIVAGIQTKAGDSLNHSGISEIFSIRMEDLNTTQLTNLKGFSALPQFSPNGKFVAFHKCGNEGCDIYSMNSDGSDLQNLTKGEDDNRWPRWSPNGKWLMFTKTKEGSSSDIYLISRDGKTVEPVITTEFRDEIAIFKPN
ncbi:TolB family protein [Gracilimonas sp. BCB1]|uniref:TolB family protein n=1 Tax=Gracilimonas sp. BCB1 TaxID=3152362 RepID=UPI0032D95CB7